MTVTAQRLALALAGAAVPAALLVPTGSGSGGIASRTATIATISSVDYRAALVARATSAGRAPTARVTVRISARSGRSWRPAPSRQVPGRYFWNTVTGPRSVCRLEIQTVGGTARPQLLVRLLVSPAVGCGPARTIPLPG